jgi:hypothetical protein
MKENSPVSQLGNSVDRPWGVSEIGGISSVDRVNVCSRRDAIDKALVDWPDVDRRGRDQSPGVTMADDGLIAADRTPRQLRVRQGTSSASCKYKGTTEPYFWGPSPSRGTQSRRRPLRVLDPHPHAGAVADGLCPRKVSERSAGERLRGCRHSGRGTRAVGRRDTDLTRMKFRRRVPTRVRGHQRVLLRPRDFAVGIDFVPLTWTFAASTAQRSIPATSSNQPLDSSPGDRRGAVDGRRWTAGFRSPSRRLRDPPDGTGRERVQSELRS